MMVKQTKFLQNLALKKKQKKENTGHQAERRSTMPVSSGNLDGLYENHPTIDSYIHSHIHKVLKTKAGLEPESLIEKLYPTIKTQFSNEAKSIILDDIAIAEDGNSYEKKHAKYENTTQQYGHFIKELIQGESFGDLALLKPGTVRSATILCKTNCEFLTLDSENYNSFVKKTRDLKVQFLNQIFGLYDALSSTSIKNLVFYSFKTEGFKEAEIITDEDQKALSLKIYVLQTGECQVQQKVKVDIQGLDKQNQAAFEQLKWIPICKIGPGAIIGEEILMQKHDSKYRYRVVALSKKVTVLSVSKQVLRTSFPQICKQLQNVFRDKEEQRILAYENQVAKSVKQSESANKRDFFIKSNTKLATHIKRSSIYNFSNRIQNDGSPGRSNSVPAVEDGGMNLKLEDFGEVVSSGKCNNGFSSPSNSVYTSPQNNKGSMGLFKKSISTLFSKEETPSQISRLQANQTDDLALNKQIRPIPERPSNSSKKLEFDVVDPRLNDQNNSVLALAHVSPKAELFSTPNNRKNAFTVRSNPNKALANLFSTPSSTLTRTARVQTTGKQNSKQNISEMDKTTDNNQYESPGQFKSSVFKDQIEQKIIRLKPNPPVLDEKDLLLNNSSTDIAFLHKLKFLKTVDMSSPKQAGIFCEKLNIFSETESKKIAEAKRRRLIIFKGGETKNFLKHSHQSIDHIVTRVKVKQILENERKGIKPLSLNVTCENFRSLSQIKSPSTISEKLSGIGLIQSNNMGGDAASKLTELDLQRNRKLTKSLLIDIQAKESFSPASSSIRNARKLTGSNHMHSSTATSFKTAAGATHSGDWSPITLMKWTKFRDVSPVNVNRK